LDHGRLSAALPVAKEEGREKMKEKELDEMSAVRKLTYNGVQVSGKEIGVSDRSPAGLKLWSVIDFLCHYCGYRWGHVK